MHIQRILEGQQPIGLHTFLMAQVGGIYHVLRPFVLQSLSEFKYTSNERRSTYQSVSQSTNQPTKQSINQSINQPIN